jgi:hypothetical protein
MITKTNTTSCELPQTVNREQATAAIFAAEGRLSSAAMECFLPRAHPLQCVCLRCSVLPESMFQFADEYTKINGNRHSDEVKSVYP